MTRFYNEIYIVHNFNPCYIDLTEL